MLNKFVIYLRKSPSRMLEVLTVFLLYMLKCKGRAEKIVQLVKLWPHKYKSPSLILRTHVKKLGMVEVSLLFHLWGSRNKRLPRACGPASLVYLATSTPVKALSQNTRWTVPEEQHPRLTSDFPHTHTNVRGKMTEEQTVEFPCKM